MTETDPGFEGSPGARPEKTPRDPRPVDRLRLRALLSGPAAGFLAAPVSAAPLALFRAAFGLLMLCAVVRFWSKGWIAELYVLPEFHFTYRGFEWVRPLGDFGTHALFAVIGLAALGLMLGWRTRFSAAVFFLGFTYAELMDKANYLNHYYFVSLVAFLLLWVDSGAAFSLDARRRNRNGPESESNLRVSGKAGGRAEVDSEGEEAQGKETVAAGSALVPRWHIGIFRAQIALVYFFAGLAKVNADWLLEAQPLSLWLPAKAHLPLIGPLLDWQFTAFAFSWAGAAFDLFIPFFLVRRQTAAAAYALVVVFHVLTAWLFPVIGVFPYVMMVMGWIFLPAAFHTRVVGILSRPFSASDPRPQPSPLLRGDGPGRLTSGAQARPRLSPWIAAGLSAFFLFQILWPMRYLTYSGPLFWTEEGYRFSWRVMLMEKAGHAVFYVSDPATGRRAEIETCAYLTPWQERMMATQPDMILQFARHLAADYRNRGIENPQVRVKSHVTLNGQGSRPYVDASVDLAALSNKVPRHAWLHAYGDSR